MSEPLVTLRELSIVRDDGLRPDLDGFSLAIEKGETVIMLGEADAGKDALMRVMAGAPDRRERITGSAQFGVGAHISADSLAASPMRIAYVPGPHTRPLSDYATAASQLARVIARKTSLPHASARAELGLTLTRLKGAPLLDTLESTPTNIAPDVLAWGLLATGFAVAPELLLVDHLLIGLPPTAARALVRALVAEKERQGFAILYNALGTEIAHWLGGRLIVMRHGRIVEEGPASRLTTTQAHAYTQTLLRQPAVPASAAKVSRAGARGQPVIQAYALEANAHDRITFELRRGGSLALIGEQGSGRHVFVRRLLGLERIRSGRVVFDAIDIGVLSGPMRSRMRRRVAVIAGADDVLDPRLTVSDTVSEPLRASLDLPMRLVDGYRDAALKRVGLSSVNRELPVAHLSAFDGRRLQVARAIVSAPILALIDEPFRGLDAFARSVMRDLLRNLRAEEGPAFLVITSDVNVAQALADEAMVFKDGRIVERGLLTEILRAPKEPYTRALIDAVSLVL